MNHRLPPLSALRAFEAAARLGRMTAAADELSVTPGAISRQVRLLEEHLGAPLFEGSKARPTLTPAARVLQPVLTTAFAHIADAVREIGDSSRGPLDVACFSTFTVKWLIPRLFDFQARHPGIEVRLRTTEADTSAASMGCDASITVQESHADRDATTQTLLFPEHLGPVLSPALAERVLLRHSTNIASPVLAPLMLHTRTRRNAWAMWVAAVGADTPAPATGPEFEHYFFTLEAAVRGLGVAVAPWHLVMDDVQAGRLVAPLGFAASGYDYVLRRRAGGHPRLDVFCAWLQAQAGATPPPPVAP